MFRDFLHESQPVVYRALKNACDNNRISSAYLFTGPAGTPKYETAVFLAQSIFCERQNGLACEECSTCRRVREGTYADMVVLDGKNNTISKEMADALQERFSKTALEKNGQRVYIIRNCENATASAQNSMLKFLEEPPADTTAILTADNVSRILPTILSRCTILPFLPMNPDSWYKAATEEGVSSEVAYLLSGGGYDLSDIQTLAQGQEYGNAVNMLKQFLDIDGLRHEEFLIDYEISWRSHSTDRDKAKKSDLLLLRLFFDLLDLFLHDAIRKEDKGPAWYHNAVLHSPYNADECARMIILVNEQKDQVNKFNDLNLLIDQTFYRLEEYNQNDRRL